MQMATLGISTLSQQKFVAESADARRLDRVDTNSMLAMVSMELEQKLQKAFQSYLLNMSELNHQK